MTIAGYDYLLGASTLGPGSPAAGVRGVRIVDGATLELGPEWWVGKNPMFLSPTLGGAVAVVHELPRGQVSLARVRGDRLISGVPSATGAAGPCHVASSGEGTWVFVAIFTGGSMSVHRVTGHEVGASAMQVRYDASGLHPDMRASPHPHQIVVDGRSGLVFIPDLGMDVIHVHKIEDLTALDPVHVDFSLPGGAGPRHLVVMGDRLIVTNELDRTVVVLDSRTGEIRARANASCRAGTTPGPGTSAIRVTAGGLVLVANRGPGTIAALAWEREGDTLTYLGESACGGVHPRDVELSHDERFLIVANQWSDELALLEIDHVTGVLSVRDVVKTPSPACIVRA